MTNIKFTEHEAFNPPANYCGKIPTSGYEFGVDATNQTTAKNFGLSFTEASNKEIKIGPYVGVVRLPDDNDKLTIIAESRPKKFDENTIDYAAMFDACLGDAIVSRHLNKCFFIWPEEPKILRKEDDLFRKLLIFAYINELHSLCQKHLRRNTIRRSENLVGRVKGRILVPQQIRQNHAINRPERMICNFIEHHLDCRENRILCAALEVAASFLNQKNLAFPNLQQKISYCRAALDGVAVTRIKQRDFLDIRYAGAFHHYKPAHKLAKAVLFSLGINQEDRSQPQNSNGIYPFVLCTFELFERYVETLLRKKFPNANIWVGYDNNDLSIDGENYKVRPDFIIMTHDNKALIIDAKYKIADTDNNDAYKSVAYCYHEGVITQIKQMVEDIHSDDHVKQIIDNRTSILLYPELVDDIESSDNNLNYESVNSFKKLSKGKIKSPKLNI